MPKKSRRRLAIVTGVAALIATGALLLPVLLCRGNGLVERARIKLPYPGRSVPQVECKVDVNGDGFRDVLVSAASAEDPALARLYSGATGALLQTYDAPSRVTGALRALMVRRRHGGHGYSAIAMCASGLVYEFYPDSELCRTNSLGVDVGEHLIATEVGDVNGDGLPDILAAGVTDCSAELSTIQVIVVDRHGLGVIGLWELSVAARVLKLSVAQLGDWGRSGPVGAVVALSAGEARLFSVDLRRGSIIYERSLGHASGGLPGFSFVGDWNDDGVCDMWLSAWGGQAALISGLDGATMDEFEARIDKAIPVRKGVDGPLLVGTSFQGKSCALLSWHAMYFNVDPGPPCAVRSFEYSSFTGGRVFVVAPDEVIHEATVLLLTEKCIIVVGEESYLSPRI